MQNSQQNDYVLNEWGQIYNDMWQYVTTFFKDIWQSVTTFYQLVWQYCKWLAQILLNSAIKPIQWAASPFIWINARLYPESVADAKFYGYLFAWVLSLLSLIALAMHKKSPTYTAICIGLGGFACFAYGRRLTRTAVPAIVISIEIFTDVYQASLTSQMITTASVFVLVCALKYTRTRHLIDINVQYTFIWATARLVRAMKLNTSPPAQWRLSQICLSTMVVVHLMRCFVPRKGPRSSESVFWTLTAFGETFINGGLLVVVLLLYDTAHVLPWEIHIGLLVVPLAYIAAATLPAENKSYQPRKMPRRSFVRGALEFLAGCLALASTTVAFVYNRPVDTVIVANDPCGTQLTNLHTCTSANEVNRFFVTGECCMPAGYMVVPGIAAVRAAPENTCRATLTTVGKTVDCCGAEITPQTEDLLSGPYACICNQSPNYNNGNRLVNGACVCNAATYSGTACETKL